MTQFTELYSEIRNAVAKSQIKEIENIRYNTLHNEAILINLGHNKVTPEYIDTCNEIIPQRAYNKLLESLEVYDREQWLEEKYTLGYDTMYLHKSNRTFSTNSSIEPKDAYSIKQESGLSWKQLKYLFNN